MRRPGAKQVRHVFSASDYKNATQNYAQDWALLDQTLYRLCSKHPLHTDRLSVTAKVVLIGRTYATGIERKVPTTGTQGSSILQVVKLFVFNGKQIDQWLARLPQGAASLSSSNVSEILNVHGLILKLLSGLTIDGQSARTFVSKYLHFHNPIVPIYDSVVQEFLPKLVRLRKGRTTYTAAHADHVYATYVSRFATLCASASQSATITVRLLDYYLIWKKENP